MKTNPPPPLAALLAVLTVWPLTAQTVTPSTDKPKDDEAVLLTPFEVTSSKDTGYQATETLAGTRIRTNLADVGGAISVITKQFLLDIGATDVTTLLQYTTNTEVAGTRGTYAGVGNGTSVDEIGNLRAPQGAQRVRGLAAADNSRDFFVSDIPWDFYSIERIDIQRGPNSILFGLGSPAGMVNATTRNAEFRNFGSVEARIGSYGTVRGALDLNQQLIPKTLSLRLDALRGNEKFRQEPAFEDNRRIYGTLRYDPQLFKNQGFHTSLKAKYENGDVRANRPRTVTPNDNISAWYRPTAVSASNPFGGLGKLAVNNPYDPWRTDNVVAGDGRGLIQTSTVNYQPWLSNLVNAQQPYWAIDGSTNQLYRIMGGWINAGARNTTGGLTGAAVGLLGKRTNDNFYAVGGLPQAAVGANLPGAQYGQYRQQSLLDSSIFDYNNILIDGNTKSEYQKWDTYNLSFSQTGWRDRVGLEVAYDRQKYRSGGTSFLGWAPTISVDILKNFPDYYTSGANGTTSVTNPNFGRPFVSSNSGGSGSSYQSNREYVRASLFGEIRSRDLVRNEFLARLLGKHRFTGVYSGEEYSTETRGWIETANSRDWAAYWNGTDGLGSSIQDRAPLAFIYLGPSVANRTSAAGAAIPGISAPVRLADGGVYVFDPTWTNNSVGFGDPWNVPTSLFGVFNGLPNPESTAQLTQASNPANYRGWTNYPMTLMRYDGGRNTDLLTRAQMTMRKTRSFAGSWQGFLWNDSIVTTLGWRFDEVKGKAVNALPVGNNRNILNLNPSVYKLPDTYPASQIFKDHSTSGGVVGHLNRMLPRDRLPLNVSVSYSKSDNFQVTDTRRDIYGNPIANPTGSTKDYGLVLSTKDGKYSFRAIKYTTSVKGASTGLSDAAGIGRVVAQGLRFRNVFLYKLGVYDWATREQWQTRNTWGSTVNPQNPTQTIGANQNLTAAEGRALEDSAIRTWNEIQAWLTGKGFFQAWGFTPQPLSTLTDRTTYERAKSAPEALDPAPQYAPTAANVFAYVATPPPGFTVTNDTESKGYEFELTANPTPSWRVAFNASETTAVRRNVGGSLLDEYIAYLDSKLIGTPAGNLPQFGNTSLSIYANVFGPWRANYVLMKLQEGAAAPEIRKWRYNFVSNYSFREGRLKGVGVGGSYRWQDKVVIGYPVTADGKFNLTKPYFGPAEDGVDLWANYERKLTNRINWKVQLNVRNAFARDGLIPVSIEPDGSTWASVRVKPNREWFVTNTFSF